MTECSLASRTSLEIGSMRESSLHNRRYRQFGLSRVRLQMFDNASARGVYFKASGCLDSTPQNLLTGNLQPRWLCRCSMWAREPVLDSFNACTGPWQYLQRIISPRSVRASYRVQGSQRPRTLTSHSVITGGFFLVAIGGSDAPERYRDYRLLICIPATRTIPVREMKRR
jgi:hypothetical protein